MNETYAKLGMKPADILLPRDADMSKWAVVACDQFTSQPEYWEEADRIVGDAPSTLRLILPESKLNDPNVEEHIADINRSMEDYLARDIFKTCPDSSIIYIQRTQSDGKVRHGLVAAVDLEQYDYTPGSGSLIRATEGHGTGAHPAPGPGAEGRPPSSCPTSCCSSTTRTKPASSPSPPPWTPWSRCTTLT